MFGKRDFLEDSSSSFEADNPGTPPASYMQQVKFGEAPIEKEFDFEDKPVTGKDIFNTSPERARGVTLSTNAPNFQPIKKETSEKVGFVNFIEENPEEPAERPTTSLRPGSSSAQMRAKMLEAQKSKLMSRPGGSIVVQSSTLLTPSIKTQSGIDNLIYSSNVFTEKDISDTKALKAFNTGINYEPGLLRNHIDNIPGPIKPEVTFIKNDEIEEVKLDEKNSIRNTPSKNLQEIHKQIEESKKQTRVSEPVDKTIESQPRLDQRFQAEEIAPKLEETKKPPESLSKKLDELLKPLKEEEKTKGEPEDTKKPEELKEIIRPRQQVINVRDIISNEMKDMKKFLTSPIVRGITLQCTIRRDKSGFNRLFPKYFMSISEGLIFLLAGKKRAGNRTSNYMVTTNQKEFNTKSSSFIGKVRSNFLGTEFMMYDSGLNPKRKGANPNNVRSEVGVVLYESNIMGSKGPRKMRVLTPAINSNNEQAIWKPMNKNDGMINSYKEGKTNSMFVFFNKPPKWNEHVQAFVLNFNGRVDKASVKNFQLIDDKDENKIYLQFGRVGDQLFNLDFQWPFSPLQAFAIALTSFDNKFACE